MPNVYNPRDQETPSEAVIAAVADATDQSPRDLESLFETVDPDALDALVDWNDGESTVSVSFVYVGYDVTVDSDGVKLDMAT